MRGDTTKNLLAEKSLVEHPFPPLYDKNSRILILGSFPSVMSRRTQFFYGHPQNRFWKVMAAVLGCEVPQTVEQKRHMLFFHGIAVWDVLQSCEIIGSSDASIVSPKPNDLSEIFSCADICAVYTNGTTSHNYYTRLCQPQTGMAAIRLPSTSPANAAWSLERLTEAWSVILEFLHLD
ncbi:MAG: DNA-deoxyinosine glycosylase [Ruminococcaceae bacterium]|nr:DNA-deoxyinosine glycosylase [Oscillospiraceae bacterium]